MLQGNLRTMALPDVLQWIALGQKTGSLLVRRGATETRILFRDGSLFSSWSNDPRESLGQFLIRDRLATESGLSPVAIMDETARRANILRLMHESRRFPDIAAVTRLCQLYSAQPEEALRRLGTSAAQLARR